MTLVTQFDGQGMNRVANALFDALMGAGQSGDAHNLLRDEGRRLATQFVAFTPPLGAGGRNAGARQAGEQAIQRELNSLIAEVRPDLIAEVSGKYGTANIRTFREGTDKQPIELQWENLDLTGARLPELHKRYRGYRGKIALRKQRTGKWFARVVVPEGTRQPYINQVKKRVGRWRASIGAIIPLLGGKLPAWIARHLGSVQQYQIVDLSQLNHPSKPELTFGTRFPGVSNPQYRYRERMAAAMRARVRAMRKRCELVVSGYARDVSQAIRPRKRAAETAFEPEVAME